MKTLISLFVCTFSLIINSVLFSQDARLCVQTGHSSGINSVCFNFNNELVASCGDDNKVVVWHVLSGKQFSNFTSHKSIVTQIIFHPKKNILYSLSLDSTLCVWDIDNNLLDTTLKFDYPLGSISISSDGNYLIIGGKELIMMDTHYYKRTKYGIRARQLFTCVEFSNNNEWIAVGGKQEKKAYLIYLPNKEIRQLQLIGINDAKFSENDSSVFMATENGQLIESDLYTKNVKSSATKNELNAYNNLTLTKTKIIGVTDDGTIEVFNRKNWSRKVGFEGHLQTVTCIDVMQNERYIITGSDDKKLILWDLEKEEMIRSYKSTSYKINHLAFDESGDEIIIGFANGFVRKSNLLNNGSLSNRLKLNQIMIETGWEYHLIEIDSFNANKITFKAVLTRKSSEREVGFDLIKDIRLTWDLNTNELDVIQENEKSQATLNYEANAKRGKWFDEIFFMNDSLLTDEKNKLIAEIKGNYLTVKSALTNKIKFTVEMNHTDRVTSVAINQKHNFVATGSWDGMISFWSLADGRHLTTYGAFNSSDFIYLTEDNHYFSSKGALNNIGFVLKDQVFSFDQFDLKYNRPDLVFKNLPYIDEKTINNYYLAYKKRLSKLGMTEENLTISSDIPKLQVTLDNASVSYDGLLRYEVIADEQKNLLSSFHILVNGVPEFTRAGKKINGNYFRTKDSLVLNPGVNVIQFYVTNRNGSSSLKQSFEINNRGKHKTPDLYIVTIGCSSYQQNQYNLNYAQKDALDIENFFKKSNEFRKVFTRSVTNEAVNKEKVNELKTFLENVRVDDVVLLFIAGHGVLDANLDYYLATHDMDFSKPQERGIPISFFEELLDNIKSRKKLMLIDACHSGEIDKSEVVIDTTTAITETEGISFRAVGASVKNINEVNTFELSRIVFADVRESNGSTVISSAGGGEFAFEGDEWSNGVFTYVLLNGLKSKEADLNSDGKVMISEMHAYLIYHVNQFTNGKQTPTSRVENLINDFQID